MPTIPMTRNELNATGVCSRQGPCGVREVPPVRVPREWPRAAKRLPPSGWLLATLAMSALAGCASVPTPYVKREVALPEIGAVTISGGSKYGYASNEISDRFVRVTFRGNASTSGFRAADFALLRCAEVALEHDHPYFVIQERNDTTRESTRTTTSPGVPMTSCNKKGRCTTTYGTSTTTTQTWVYPNLEYIVELLSAPPEDETRFALDAAEVGRTIRAKYDIEGAPQ